ncbi:MAG: AAA family ATPase [Fibrobacterota bacterium]
MPYFDKLLEFNELARKEVGKYSLRRFLYTALAKDNGRHFIGIVGPRGTGKTVLLRQLLLEKENSFYISLDAIDEIDLFEVASRLSTDFKIRNLLIDEAHFYGDFNKVIKKIYDFLPGLRVIFTSSVSLSVYESSHDLGRRVILHPLYPFSFGEYLLFKTNKTLPRLSLEQIIAGEYPGEYLLQSYHFESYLRGGLMPFALEEPEPLVLLKNVLHTIIHRDIPHIGKVTIQELPRIEKCVAFIGKAAVEGINYSSIASNVGITRYKAEIYTQLLRDAFILHPIFPEGTNVLREPKILMCLPYRLLFREYDDAIGGLREDFFAEVMRMRNVNFHYLKTTRGAKTPDFSLTVGDEKYVFEIGGKNKGREQFKGVGAMKKIILSHGGKTDGIRRPLHLIGFV